MGQDGRNEVERSVAALEARRVAGGQPSFHMPFSQLGVGLSLSYASDANLGEERARCAARMLQGGNKRWILVQFDNEASCVVKSIHAITPTTLNEADLARGRAYIDQQVATRAAEREIGRNERCPCGSGKKYKVCHGR
jgi:hypothetical protein